MSHFTPSLDELYHGSVAEKLEFARKLFAEYGTLFRHDPDFNRLFHALCDSAAQLERQMSSMDLGVLCASCGTTGSGGCCSLYMAAETDTLQILMNLMVTEELAMVRNDGRECVYLGERGCIFRFKPIFCLNYTCSHIYQATPPGQIREMERLTGRLLGKQVEVEQYMLNFFRNCAWECG